MNTPTVSRGNAHPRRACACRYVEGYVVASRRPSLGTASREVTPHSSPNLRRTLAALPASPLLLAWAGEFHRAALVVVDVSDLVVDAESLRVVIYRDNNDQEGRGRLLALSVPSAAEVYVVRSFAPGSRPTVSSRARAFATPIGAGRSDAARLSDHAVTLASAEAVSIGLDAPTFTKDSLCTGFGTSAARAGKAERDITRQPGRRSRAMPECADRAAQRGSTTPPRGCCSSLDFLFRAVHT
jgi:hypothetical protein